MPWFKVDDGLPTSRKLLSIPRRMRLPALGLWTIAGAWSAGELTDGHVPVYMLEEWGATVAQAACLVDAGLWYAERNGYVFHDWHDYQPERARVLEDRENAKIRMKRVREARRSGEQGANVQANAPRTSGEVRSTPTRPDPTHKRTASPAVTESDFEAAWSHWPKKTERKKSLEKFRVVARARGLDVLTADVIRFGQAYARTTERQFVPALVVWLNGERWTDELPMSSDAKPKQAQPKVRTFEEFLEHKQAVMNRA